MKNLLLFSLSGSVCRALLLSPEHLPVDIHSIQPPPPPIVCECLISFYFYLFLFFKRCSGWLLFSRYCTFKTKKKKVLAMKEWGLAIVFRYPLIHFHPTMSHILCCSKCFISSRCYYNIGRARYPHFVISSPPHTHPPPKKNWKEKCVGN